MAIVLNRQLTFHLLALWRWIRFEIESQERGTSNSVFRVIQTRRQFQTENNRTVFPTLATIERIARVSRSFAVSPETSLSNFPLILTRSSGLISTGWLEFEERCVRKNERARSRLVVFSLKENMFCLRRELNGDSLDQLGTGAGNPQFCSRLHTDRDILAGTRWSPKDYTDIKQNKLLQTHVFLIFYYFLILLFCYFLILLFSYFAISLFRYFAISLFRYFAISSFRHFVISLFRYFFTILLFYLEMQLMGFIVQCVLVLWKFTIWVEVIFKVV